MHPAFLSNAAAVLFGLVVLIAVVSLISRTESVLLTVAALLAGVGGLVLALAR